MSQASLIDRGLIRACDVVVAAAVGVFFAPLVAMAALGMALETGRAPFYARRFDDRRGQAFRLWTLGIEPNANAFSRIGAFLCEARLQGLPHLLNVLAGQVSLVGPPAKPAGWTLPAPGYRPSGGIRPGLVGPRQISAALGVGAAEARTMDADYANGPTFANYLSILSSAFGAAVAPSKSPPAKF